MDPDQIKAEVAPHVEDLLPNGSLDTVAEVAGGPLPLGVPEFYYLIKSAGGLDSMESLHKIVDMIPINTDNFFMILFRDMFSSNEILSIIESLMEHADVKFIDLFITVTACISGGLQMVKTGPPPGFAPGMEGIIEYFSSNQESAISKGVSEILRTDDFNALVLKYGI